MNGEAGIKLAGKWEFVCENADGSEAWREEIHNMTCNAGLTDMLSVYLGAGSQTTAWFMGLIDASGYSALAAADTPGSHAGWVECTAYTEATRPAFAPAAAAGQAITSTTLTTFTMNATKTIQGAFLTSLSTKGGTTGIMFATGLLSSPRALISTQLLKLSYSCSATGS